MFASAKKESKRVLPLRVCLVAPRPPPYGGIGHWTALVRRFAHSRTDIQLQIVDTAPRWRAIDDQSIWKRLIGGGLQLVRDYARFWRVLRTRPDVVHLTTSGQFAIIRDLVILASARCKGISAIYHLHFGRVPQMAAANTWEWRMLARAIRMAHVVIAIDRETASTIAQHFPKGRTIQLPNGVDLQVLPTCGRSAALTTVLFLGWVIPTKGVGELVQAWKKLNINGWRCVVAGPRAENYREELRQRFQPEHLEFLPEQSHDDAMQLMAAADVFVLPSYTEGFPNVIVEAMAMGKPIIATRVGAIPEMLAGECGVLVPPRDADALCAALRLVLSDADLRTALGAKAHDKARTEYAMDKVFEQCVSIWREAAADS